ncbi:MAG: enoyl-CoA hydratase/isomerase family protein [Candidatus Nanopelagicales bacterium]|nr:enoyl-CoA hydratase/isomerase family protein [Candidatus Nanopelagicales bacterium]
MPARVTLEQRDRVGLIRIDDGKVNALDVELLSELGAVLATVDGAAAIVITGNGRAFSAGLDLRALLAADLGYAEALLVELERVSLAIFTSDRPVVAAVDGPAIAGGAILAIAADLRLMSHGVIGLPELQVGVPIPPVLIEISRHVLGARLQRHLLDGVAVDIDQALAIGLIDEVHPRESLVDAAVTRAQALAQAPMVTYAQMKRQLQAGALAAIAAVPAGLSEEVRASWTSDAVRAGIQAQVERMSRR